MDTSDSALFRSHQIGLCFISRAHFCLLLACVGFLPAFGQTANLGIADKTIDDSTVVRFYKAVLLDQNDVPRDSGIADLLLQMLAILVVYAGIG
jgi:hypothetical protein